MKHLLKLISVLGVGLILCANGQAEPTQTEKFGASPMDNPITLNSPCYAAAAQSKKLGLQIATLAGREVAEPLSTDVKKYLDTLRDRYFLVEGRLIDCLASEKAYSQSFMVNKGMSGGAAETAAYVAAAESLQRTVSELPKSVPGESELDRSLNSTLSDFYGAWLSRFDSYENMKSVDGIHGRLRESLAKLSQASVDCRAENRMNGRNECPELEAELADANFLLDSRVATLAPKVAALSKSVESSQAAKEAYKSQAQQIQQQMMYTQYWIGQHQATAEYLGSVAQAYMGYYQYYLYYGNVFHYYSWYYGVYGQWGTANYYWWLACCYWSAAGSCLNVFYWFMNALNIYMAAIMTLMQQMHALHNSEPGVIANIEAAEWDLNTNKALLIGIPVERL